MVCIMRVENVHLRKEYNMATMIANSSTKFRLSVKEYYNRAHDQRRTMFHGEVDGEFAELIQDGHGEWTLYDEEGDFVDSRGREYDYHLMRMSEEEYKDVVRMIRNDLGKLKNPYGLPLGTAPAESRRLSIRVHSV